jgi:glutamate--cysteine ligase catalytic subunit
LLQQAAKYAHYIRTHGIEQFLAMFDSQKGREQDLLQWGDEIEYMIVELDKEKKTAKLSLRAKELLETLQKAEHHHTKGSYASHAKGLLMLISPWQSASACPLASRVR